MKWVVYNILFALVYPFLLPGFLVRMLKRGGYAARMGDRFAIYPEGLFGKSRPLFDSHAPKSGSRAIGRSNGSYVWIHAVSVGEVQVAGQLMREWRQADPGVRFCFSTTSSTGWKMAEREVGDGDVLIYNPLDFPNFVKSALKTVRPMAIVLTESEIWPNFILQAKKMGIPVFLVNARVSDRSAPRYKAAKWFFGDVLSCFARIFAQSDLDKARLVAAGAPAERVEVTGSFKFDVARRNAAKEKELGKWIFGENGAPEVRTRVLLGGSTWPGEDEVLLRIYRNLISQISDFKDGDVRPVPDFKDGDVKSVPDFKDGDVRPVPDFKEGDIKLVIAPRHFERADAVEANIRKSGFACIRRSRGDSVPTIRHSAPSTQHSAPSTQHPAPSTQHPAPSTQHPAPATVYLADTTGELMGLYGIADVVFVGKSLCAHGSQNMIEPCLCGKPTFVGPYTENFRPVMSDLLAADAIVQVKDEAELERGIVGLFSSLTGGKDSASPLSGLGARAKAAVEKRRGVVARCVASIRSAL